MMLKSNETLHDEIHALHWIPLASFATAIFIASCGILSLPYLVITEVMSVMPARLKDLGVSFVMSLIWIFSFVCTKFLPYMIETLSFQGTLFLFAAVCLFGGLYIMLAMPETKGKSREEIMAALR